MTDTNGLIYMRARYYSPELHRFINADILAGDIANAVTLNRYAYANGNPVSLIDPRGLSADRHSSSNNFYPLKSFSERKSDFWKYVFWGWDSFGYISALETCEIATANGWTEGLINGFICATQDENGYYYISQDCWQNTEWVGYNSLYDSVFTAVAGAVGDKPYYDNDSFTVGDTTYVFWWWKGDYINLGAGAECGIYEVPKDSVGKVLNNEPLNHVYTSTDNNLKMSITLEDTKNNQTIFHFTPDEYQWWVNQFDPYTQGMKTEDMRVTVSIDFSDNEGGLFDAFYKELGEDKYDEWTFDRYNQTATLVY